MSFRVGRVVIEGDSAQIALVYSALDSVSGLPGRLENLLKHDYIIEFHSPAEFIAAGRIIPGSVNPPKFPKGRAAWGYVVGRRKLWLNDGLGPQKLKYTVIHELGHAIAGDYLSQPKRKELKALLQERTDSGAYANRFEEAYADAFAEACGFLSRLDDFYRDFADADLPRLVEITFRPDMAAVPAEPISVPLPLPDPELIAAQARVAELEIALADKETALAALNQRRESILIRATEIALLAQ